MSCGLGYGLWNFFCLFYFSWGPWLFTFSDQNFQKFNVSNLAETFHTSAKYKIILVAKVSARLETFNFLYTYIFLILNKIFEKLNVSNLAETYHTSAKYKIILVAKISKWTLLSLIVDKNWQFLDHLPPFLVHVVIERPRTYGTFAVLRKTSWPDMLLWNRYHIYF